ncbi:hypothetical protein [Sulfitobacter sp. EhC04]|uniref:hypothetical protein n=1 Tax=Sulfitobacter sp. EhC04 TaxID=1849168 RepID=UPI0010FEC3F3|nr:hypothetical protein [Sulfitobacter sp. EhC04]
MPDAKPPDQEQKIHQTQLFRLPGPPLFFDQGGKRTRSAESIHDTHEFSGDGGNDDLVRLLDLSRFDAASSNCRLRPRS